MSTLAVTAKPIESRSCGYDIRVLNLCAQLPGEVHLIVVPVLDEGTSERSLSTSAVFATTETTPVLTHQRAAPLRHLRLSDDHFLRHTSARELRVARRRIDRAVRDRGVERVVAFGSEIAEVVATIDSVPVVLDVCDSRSLTMRRRAEGATDWSPLQRLKSSIDLWRTEATEARLPGRFRCVTTVSGPDTDQVRRLAGDAANVLTVPNGVDEVFLAPPLRAPDAHGVVFWGNLSFEPNQDALRFFLDEVYEPFLKAWGVPFRVLGPHAPAWLAQRAAADALLCLDGFVPDLRESLSSSAVMVNPMRLGSGLKNKVLEAFAMGIPVVSTHRGIEALQPVQDGTEVFLADEPASFAARVRDLLDDVKKQEEVGTAARLLVERRHRWDAIGVTWRQVVTGRAAAMG